MSDQNEYHGYIDDVYQGLVIATAEQLANMGMIAGDGPPPALIGTIRANAIAAMIARIDQFTAQFTAGVPKDEMASWPTKAAGAEVVLSGGTSAIISAEAATLGVDAMTVATDIATRSTQYAAIIGAVTGVRRSAEAGIAAAGDQAEVDAALAAAMATAVSIATSMGLEF